MSKHEPEEQIYEIKLVEFDGSYPRRLCGLKSKVSAYGDPECHPQIH